MEDEGRATLRIRKKAEQQKSEERRRKEEKERRREKRHERKEKRKERRRSKSEGRKGKKKKDRKSACSSDEFVDDEHTKSASEGGTSSRGSEEERDPTDICAEMLNKFGNIAGDMKQLFELIDNGQAVDIKDLPDPSMKACLVALFHSLGLRRSPIGLYSSSQGSTPTLQSLGPLLQRTEPTCVAEITTSFTDEANVLTRDLSASGPKQDIGPDMGPLKRNEYLPETATGKGELKPIIGPALPPSDGLPSTMPAVPNPQEASQDGELSQGRRDEERMTGQDDSFPEIVIGPSSYPIKDEVPQKRVFGPSVPPPEVLAAAQQTMEHWDDDEDDDDEDNIGPMPSAMAKEAENATEAERFDEVTRILAPDASPYDVLGVNSNFGKADLKKRYRTLSLLVHPDKCSHPLAKQAFTALNAALKDLQDPITRAAADTKIANRQAKLEYEAELKARKEAAEWRRLRGETVPGDDELLNGPAQPLQRGSWMTELPPERQAKQATINTFFSRKEQTGRGDTSEWTDTPEMKAKKAKDMYLEGNAQARLQGPEAPVSKILEAQKIAKTAALVDKYNAAKRSQSLLEKHQTEQGEVPRKKKKRKGEADEADELKPKDAESWQDSHPWRPWDRETDLSAGRQQVKMDKDSMTQGLASRFGGTVTDRKFL